MKKIILIVLLASVSFLGLSCIGTGKNAKTNQNSISKNVSAEEFKKLIDNKEGTLLDVRTSNEVEQGAISGSINIDYYSPTFKEELSKLDKSKAVYVYCRSGGRSGKAMKIMTDLGFNEVYNLVGGYGSWPYK